jgi:hypothetical protein
LGIAHPFEAATVPAIGRPLGKIDGIAQRERPRIEWIR